MQYLIAQIEKFAPKSKHAGNDGALKVIAMIENARGMVELKEIIRAGKGYIDGLLVSFNYPTPKANRLIRVRCGGLYVDALLRGSPGLLTTLM